MENRMNKTPLIWTCRDVDDSDNIILVDLDGTLAGDYERPFDPWVIADPRQEVVDDVATVRNNGNRIVVWTCRTSHYWDTNKRNPGREKRFQLIHNWMVKHGIEYDGILDHDKPIFKSYLCDNSYNADNSADMVWKHGVRD
jgi:hypothetical protein